jgi:hypothetical protein
MGLSEKRELVVTLLAIKLSFVNGERGGGIIVSIINNNLGLSKTASFADDNSVSAQTP